MFFCQQLSSKEKKKIEVFVFHQIMDGGGVSETVQKK